MKEINDSKNNCNWLLFNLRNCLMVYRLLNVSRKVSNVKKEEPTLAIWLKQLKLNPNQIYFKNEFGQAKWVCLSYWDL